MLQAFITARISRIKVILGILSALLLFSDVHSDEITKSKVHEVLTKMSVKSQAPCQKVIPFGNCAINKPEGFVIDKPGKYCLCENSSRRQSGPAVTITASNVVIDLNQYTLSGNNTATVGIVANNASNLIIENGTVRNFTVNGVSISGCDLVDLDNLIVLQNGTATGPIVTGGLLILNSSQIDMNAVNLSENFQFGLGMSGVDKANFINSRSNLTKGFDSGGLFGNVAYGIMVTATGSSPFTAGSSDLNFINSVVDETSGGDSAFGFLIDSLVLGDSPNENILIANCAVNDTVQTNVTPAGLYFAEGITVGGAIQFTCEHCIVDTVSVAATTDAPSSHVVGIETALTNLATINDCSVGNLSGIANYVHGFDIEGGGNDITFNNCTVFSVTNNSTNPNHFAFGYAILKPLGIVTNDAVGTGTIVQNCIAQNVHGLISSPRATAAGLLINAQANLVVEKNIFNNNDNGIIAQDIATGENPALVSSNCIVSNNITAGNRFFGIHDFTATTAQNAYFKNVARNNPSGNFVGLPANTPIVTWVIGGAPPVASEGTLDNYSITP